MSRALPITGDYPLARKRGIAALMAIFLFRGQMCPKCTIGTRVTSKRWAKCPACGARFERRALPPSKPKATAP